METFFAVICAVIAVVVYELYADPSFASSMGIASPAIDGSIPIIGWAVVVVIVILVIRKIIKSEFAVPFVTIVFSLLVVVGAISIYMYGDKNNDGQGDPLVVRPKQPSGENPAIDYQYAQINKENSKTSLRGMFSTFLLAIVLLVTIVVGTGVALAWHYRINASTNNHGEKEKGRK
jgi:hypothetical protein